MPEGKLRVAVANRADGGVIYWVAKLYGFAALVGIAGLVMSGVCLYGYFSARTDEVGPGTQHDLAAYAHHVPAVSRIYAADGTLLGEFASEWREFVPYQEIPPQ